MVQFITDNWLLIATVVFGAASEIIGASPLKNNGVVSLILTTIGSFLKKK